MMQRLGDIIRERDRKDTFSTKMREGEVLSIWEDVVGPEIAENTSPNRINNGTLFVRTKSPSWAQELKAIDATIKRMINSAARSEVIKEIRFSHDGFYKKRNLSSSKYKPDIGSIEIEEDEQELINNIASQVKDDKLKRSIVEAIIKSKKLNKWRRKNGWNVCERCNGIFSGSSKGCAFCR
ncbi:MAG: DUF721 domain-containing protein [Actinobacteria bacterium]|nr:DUF721 domain-containing protein [Actinomycetota bacterium]